MGNDVHASDWPSQGSKSSAESSKLSGLALVMPTWPSKKDCTSFSVFSVSTFSWGSI